ncbi:hypothetical protein OJ996_20150 [Luteolibacter sp. GHJ8]|jgi:hypothetical protein|uniref:Uncharacterized protein n=1 Tax=Luteolibacter rhizosphaerae TaxID=2989719 RepID=A0ABT3G7T0_9BACT|nr:hypothetical protein [Luteolibacter rhizosphaerae]MCW1915911.1 hypothetical protein [Luteolibacter rhizosphaerae]
MAHRWLFMFLYGLHLVWTGFQSGINARAYKANSLWFCLVMGLTAIAASFLFRAGRTTLAKRVSAFVVLLVFGFYLYCFVKAPAEDATLRVGLIMLSSIAAGSLVFMPAARK